MYLRTTKRRNRDGSVVTYYQLAENFYHKVKKSSQTRVIYNFGRADQLDLGVLRRLVGSIQRILLNHEAAREVVAPYAATDLEFDQVYELGVIHCLRHLWEELGIAHALTQPAFGSQPVAPHESALFVMIANRLCRPCSKLDCFENWLREEAYLPDYQGLKLDQFYRALDFLHERINTVEQEIFNRTADLFNVDVDVIFYDTTSTYFEVDAEDEEDEDGPGFRMRGHSKDDKANHPQIVIGLAVTREGLPVRSWVFPGNTADTTTIQTIKKDLRGWRLGQCILVGDAGMYSKANLKVLRQGLGRYLMAVPMRRIKEVSREVLSRGGRYQTITANLQVKEVWLDAGENDKRYIVCFNPEEAERQRKHRETLLVQLEEILMGLGSQKEAHPKRACALLASKRYGRYLKKLKSGRIKLDKTKIGGEAKYDGKFVITTNDPDLSAEDAGLGYKSLLIIESCFRRMKTTGLKLRPIYHWNRRRIEAHVTCCVIALLLQRAAEIRSGKPWREIHRELSAIKAIRYRTKNLQIVQCTKLKKSQRELLRNLGVPRPKRILAISEL